MKKYTKMNNAKKMSRKDSLKVKASDRMAMGHTETSMAKNMAIAKKRGCTDKEAKKVAMVIADEAKRRS